MWEQYFTHIYKLFLFFNGMKVLGIDEAGRGPVIGPLIIGGVMIEDGEEDKINGVKDSKLLSHKKRIELDKKIRENAEFIIIEVPPKEIDEALESDTLNLNWLEAHKKAEIINALNPDKAIIDCPSPNCKAYEKYLRDLLTNKGTKLVVEHKADVNYPTCSAASIIEKSEEKMSWMTLKACMVTRGLVILHMLQLRSLLKRTGISILKYLGNHGQHSKIRKR